VITSHDRTGAGGDPPLGTLVSIVGVAIGVPIAWWARGIAGGSIVNLGAGTAAPIATAAALVAVVALLAAWLPARAAARVVPVEALKD